MDLFYTYRTEIQCFFCGIAEDMELAPDRDWIPYFAAMGEDGQINEVVDSFTCPQCAAEKLRYDDEDNEHYLIQERAA